MVNIALGLLIITLLLMELSMITLANYNQAGFMSANSVKFVREDDAPQKRKDLTVSRKAATYQAGTNSYSIPEYRVVIRKDATDEGKPTGQRLTFDLVIRTPLASAGGDFDEALAELNALIDDPGFKDAVTRQLFPVECPCE